MTKIIHFFIDEKFTEIMISLFDKLDVYEHIYLSVPSLSGVQKFQHDKVIQLQLKDVNHYIKEVDPQLIIMHSLFPQNLAVLNELTVQTPITWFSWGGDISLGKSESYGKLFEPITLNRYFAKPKQAQFKRSFWNAVKQSFPGIFNAYYKKRSGEDWSGYILQKNFHKLSFVNTVIPSEQQIFGKYGSKVTFIHIPIGTIEHLLEGIPTDFDKEQHNTLFLGHSAFAENNQADILYQLSKFHFDGNILCPLSYGDETYIQAIINLGHSLFGNRFQPITDYLPKKDYFTLIQQSKLYVNNSIMQQGVGNIIAAVHLGVPVVLNAKGAVYEYLTNMGVQCFTVQEDLNELIHLNHILSKEDHFNNRKAIDAVYGEINVVNQLKDFLKQFDN